MNLADVMDDLAAALGNVQGLRAFPFGSDRVSPPAAVVGWPERLDYDVAYGRGGDRLTLPILVLVSRVDQRSARDALAGYLAGDGPSSVKAAVEAHEAASYDSARVTGVTLGEFTSAGTTYIGAEFATDVIGKGSS